MLGGIIQNGPAQRKEAATGVYFSILPYQA